MISERTVVKFWLPLSSTWLMMATEGPVLAAVVARLPEPIVNLAAYGVAAAVAMLIESPVIGLLSAAIALARDEQSTQQLRRFMHRLNVIVSVLMVVVCIPWVFTLLATTVIGLHDDVAWRMHLGLLCMLPWPAAIGVRRYYQGLLIRRGRTRNVAHGTVVRLTTMASSALLLSSLHVQGIVVGCTSLTVGVVFEALAIWWLAHRVKHVDSCEIEYPPLTDAKIYRFYLPLALTSIVSFAAVPLISIFVNRLPLPIESLAVLPVVNSLLFVFRSFGFSYQEVGIAFLGQDTSTYPLVRRVGTWITIGTTGAMLLTISTPILEYLFTHVFALKPRLVDLAIWPSRALIVVPITAAMYSLQRAVMITAHRTIHVSISMLIEVGSMVLLMLVFISVQATNGALAAGIATAGGMVLSTVYAIMVSRRVRRSWAAP